MTRDLAPPVFLVGAQRSGTTMLRLMLDHHPEVAFPHEMDFAVEWVSDDGRLPDLERYRCLLAAHGSFRRSRLLLDPRLDYRALMESFLRQHQGGKPVVGMAVHGHFPRLLYLWPQARFIHLLRDPRDVANSCVGMGWAGNAWAGAARWLDAERDWDALCARITPDRWIEVRYEDLVREPDVVLRRITTFLGIDYSPRMLEYATRTRYGAPDASLAEQWRTRLSREAVRSVEARVGAFLARRGYAPSGEPTLRIGRVRYARLSLGDRIGRVRHRIARYGAPLATGLALTSRLGPTSLHRALERRAFEIDDALVR